jgi:hypothetical protein
LVLICIVVHATPALASPTMIRLGYSDCATCHVSPQGGGLLTPYGRGIDVAQSLRRRHHRATTAENALCVTRLQAWFGAPPRRVEPDLDSKFIILRP